MIDASDARAAGRHPPTDIRPPAALEWRSFDLFSAWGAFVYRHRRIVTLLSVAFALVSLPLAGQASGVLGSGGWLVRHPAPDLSVPEPFDREL